MKLKNEPYRCGECKLENRVLLRDGGGDYLKDSLGNYVYSTFIADSHEQMLAHLEISHGLNTDKNDDWGQCFDCLYSYGFDNLPMGYDSAGGLLLWCYDCSQKRCLGYGNLRASIWRMLEKNNVPFTKTMSDDELVGILEERLEFLNKKGFLFGKVIKKLLNL